MPRLKINGTLVEVQAGTSILQAAEMVGYEIPRFCYHDRLSVPANCRMCLVEVKGAPKPVASCAMAAGEGMEVETESEVVKKARRGVMEMLLINHPLDCPICDQGGECDLQDQAMGYGFDRSRYRENKRAVKDKNIGPLIKTIMTRCIQCTRCVRFGEEVAGTAELGLLNRGEDVEIGTFVEKAVSTELSGNMIDICPVGALTSKPYAYKARPWELKKTETIDVHDAIGCNIRVDSRGNEVMRILPRLNEEINEEWINDRTRFAYDGLKKRRLDTPYIRNTKTKKLESATWEQALELASQKLTDATKSKVSALAGPLCAVEDMAALKDLMDNLGVKAVSGLQNGLSLSTQSRSHYLTNTPIAEIENADVILLVGTNPRYEATLVNTRIRKAVTEKRAKVAVIGEAEDLTYPYEHLGKSPSDVESLIKAKSGFSKTLKDAERPLIIVGAGALQRKDGEAIHGTLLELADKFGVVKDGWNGFNLLHQDSSQVAALDLGLTNKTDIAKSELVYLLNYDGEDVDKISKKAFVIYQGHHGDKGAHRADIILPATAYTEKDALYVNTEGRVQLGKRAVFPVGEAKEDWRILRALSEKCDVTLPYNSTLELRNHIFEKCPSYFNIDFLPEEKLVKYSNKTKNKILKTNFKSSYPDFYLANVICRASDIMSECHHSFWGNQDTQEAAE